MAELPHPSWPLRVVTNADGSRTFALCEQDGAEDLRSSAAVIASTPRGQREDDPNFGITPLAFDHAGDINTDRLAAELGQSDDRLDLTPVEILDLADAMRRVVRIT
jgi:hypothetical protein